MFHEGLLALHYIKSIIINILVVFVWQTTGVELLMKCVNIPETNDSVVSPAIVSSSFFACKVSVLKVAKSLQVGGEN